MLESVPFLYKVISNGLLVMQMFDGTAFLVEGIAGAKTVMQECVCIFIQQ